MSVKGYITHQAVADVLGRELTEMELLRLNDGLLEVAERRIDRYTGLAWLTGAVTAERYQPSGPYLQLKQRPITAVSAVRGRNYLDTTNNTLTANTDYFVDAPNGRLILDSSIWRSYQYLEVDYTAPQSVPAEVQEAAALLAASWLSAAPPEATQFERLTDGDVTVVYRDPAAQSLALPERVRELLAGYRPAVVFA